MVIILNDENIEALKNGELGIATQKWVDNCDKED